MNRFTLSRQSKLAFTFRYYGPKGGADASGYPPPLPSKVNWARHSGLLIPS